MDLQGFKRWHKIIKMCLATVSIKTTKGRINVPCGKCSECLQKRRSEWTFRLLAELRDCKSAYFVTLTYNEDTLPADENLQKNACTLFIKRLRRAQERKIPKKYNEKIWYKLRSKAVYRYPEKRKEYQLRYYLVGEYGEKFGRPHYHMILFNLFPSLLGKLQDWVDPDTGEIKQLCDLEGAWSNGNIFIGEVNQQSIHYVTKYMLQNQQTEKEVKPFAHMSRRPYIGHKYLTEEIKKYHLKNEQNKITYPDGIQQALPKIYKKKLFHNYEKFVFGNLALEENIELHQKLIKKYGLQEYMRRTTEKDRQAYRNMVKQSKSKIV